MEDAPSQTSHGRTQHTLDLNSKTTNITALDPESGQLLFTVGELQGRLSEAKKLSRLRLHVFTPSEQAIVERTFESTRTAIDHVAALCQLAPNTVKVSNQTPKFELKHSPEFQVYMARLSIVSQHLSTVFMLLYSRQESELDSTQRAATELPASPLSEQFLATMKGRHLSRRHGGMSTVSAVELPGPEPVELLGDTPLLPYLHPRSHSVPDVQELEAGDLSYHLALMGSSTSDLDLSKHAALENSTDPNDQELKKLKQDLDQLSLEAFAPRTIALSQKDPPGRRLVGKARSRRWLETQASKPTG